MVPGGTLFISTQPDPRFFEDPRGFPEDCEEVVLIHWVPFLPRRAALGQGTYSEAHLGLRDLEVWRHDLLPISFSIGFITALDCLMESS